MLHFWASLIVTACLCLPANADETTTIYVPDGMYIQAMPDPEPAFDELPGYLMISPLGETCPPGMAPAPDYDIVFTGHIGNQQVAIRREKPCWASANSLPAKRAAEAAQCASKPFRLKIRLLNNLGIRGRPELGRLSHYFALGCRLENGNILPLF